jgi:Cu/Ag efflux pump CusA
LAAVEFPLEHHALLIDNADDRNADRWRFLGLVAASAIGILSLLHAAFSSWRAALATMAVIPGALVGGLVAAAIDGDAVSVGTIAGFFALFALTVGHVLILIDRCRTLTPAELRSPRSAVVRHARERFFPTIAVAAATVAVVLPSVVLGDRAGLEIIRPMAVVILGGVITSLLVSVLVVPAVILAFGISAELGRADADGIEQVPHV